MIGIYNRDYFETIICYVKRGIAVIAKYRQILLCDVTVTRAGYKSAQDGLKKTGRVLAVHKDDGVVHGICRMIEVIEVVVGEETNGIPIKVDQVSSLRADAWYFKGNGIVVIRRSLYCGSIVAMYFYTGVQIKMTGRRTGYERRHLNTIHTCKIIDICGKDGEMSAVSFKA